MSTPEQIGIGDVEIELDGKKYVLRPTIDAVMSISRQAGGLAAAMDRVSKLDVETIAGVIQLGLGQQTSRRLANLPEIVWRAGLTDKGKGQLVIKVLDYLSNLMNGGRPRDEDAVESEVPPPQTT